MSGSQHPNMSLMSPTVYAHTFLHIIVDHDTAEGKMLEWSFRWHTTYLYFYLLVISPHVSGSPHPRWSGCRYLPSSWPQGCPAPDSNRRRSNLQQDEQNTGLSEDHRWCVWPCSGLRPSDECVTFHTDRHVGIDALAGILQPNFFNLNGEKWHPGLWG